MKLTCCTNNYKGWVVLAVPEITARKILVVNSRKDGATWQDMQEMCSWSEAEEQWNSLTVPTLIKGDSVGMAHNCCQIDIGNQQLQGWDHMHEMCSWLEVKECQKDTWGTRVAIIDMRQ